MNKLSILNSRKTKEIINYLQKQWGTTFEKELVFLENPKGRIFAVNKKFGDILIEKLRIQSVGIYFAERANQDLRLSIEGSQLVGPSSTENVIELTDEEAKSWMAGSDIKREMDANGFVIIKNNTDFLGTGKYSRTKGAILNFVPKIRRMNVIS